MGLDPGFADLGLTMVDILSDEILLLDSIHTKKRQGKKIALSDSERCDEIFAQLWEPMVAHNPVAVISESISTPRNSATARQLGMFWGLVKAGAKVLSIPIHEYSPQEIRNLIGVPKGLQGKQGKGAVSDTVLSAFPAAGEPLAKALIKERQPRVDALAAVLAFRRSPNGQFLLRAATSQD